MRDWRVAVKLIAVLTTPLLAFLVVAGVQVWSSVREASTLEDFSRRVALGGEVIAAVHDLQRERDRGVGMLASLDAIGADTPVRDASSLAPEATAVDRSVLAVRKAAQPLLNEEAFATRFRQAETRLNELQQIRRGVAEGWLRRQAVFDNYTGIIAGLQDLLPTPLEITDDPALATAVRGFTDLSLAKELTAQVRGHLYAVCSSGRFAPGEFERIADVRAGAQVAIDRFRADANQSQLARFDDTVTGQAVSNAGRLLQTIVGNARAAGLGVDAQQWWQASTTQLELMRTVESQLWESARAAVQSASSRQWQITFGGSLATFLLLLVAVVTSLVIGRTMAFALRSLKEQALQIAQDHLPNIIAGLRSSPTRAPQVRVQAIIVPTKDEVGDVAQAFTAVHRSAVRLAAEQAHMRRNVNDILIKLARRSQALVERQLKLLDTMESTEANPDQLANLFRLDHLATRLRRNDENLLVLAESDATRGRNQPVDLHTVALAATAEIEHYTRVDSAMSGDDQVVGYAVTDVVHLIAELLENATNFSPPESVVTIGGASQTDGSYAITIGDCGIGMPSRAISEANRQLAGPASIDVSAAERMGLVVVGHLAKRHGIAVRLQAGEPGIVVHVRLPAALVAASAQDSAPSPEPARFLRSAELTSAIRTGPRAIPIRAEDVLRPAAASAESVWWSREVAAPAPDTAQPRRAPKEIVVGTTAAGLPKRARSRSAAPPPQLPAPVMEETSSPQEISVFLADLHSGVRRAEDETDALNITRAI